MSCFKILVIGESSVGKTSLVHKIVYNQFDPNCRATISCDFKIKTLRKKGEIINLQMWDLAGQDRLGGLSKLYSRNSHGAIMVADICSPESMEKIHEWKKAVDEQVCDSKNRGIPMVLCLNKCDLGDISQDKVDSLREGYVQVFKTSALDGTNVENAISTLADEIISDAPDLFVKKLKADHLQVYSKSIDNKRNRCCK